jgi:bifunctional non-homologous end joining protein LigD
MAMDAVRETQLAFREGRSDKLYAIRLLRDGKAWLVTAAWGRRGNVRRVETKYSGPDRGAADVTFDRLVQEKRGKGYQNAGKEEEADSGSSAEVPRTATGRAVLPMKGWLPTDATAVEAAAMMTSPDWLAQEKENGVHVIAYVQAEGVVATNKRGEVLGLPGEVTAALRRLPAATIVAGEKLHVGPALFAPFDLLALEGQDLRSDTTERRFTELKRLGAPWKWGVEDPKTVVQLVRTAMTARENETLRTCVARERGEGLIFKRKDAPYTEGRPATGGTMRRWKFKHQADVIVMRRKEAGGPASFEMYLMVPGQLEPQYVGNVTAGKAWGELAPGELGVVMVEYAYASPPPDQKLTMPQVKRPPGAPRYLRRDKSPAECGIGQLVVARKRFGLAR